jgi:surface antigen
MHKFNLKPLRHLTLAAVLALSVSACASNNNFAPVVQNGQGGQGTIETPSAAEVLVANATDNRPFAEGYYIKKPIQCVPYARKISGLNIHGNADTWWYQAPKKGYAQGKKPQPGAVLVLKKGRKLKYGHLAVVKEILSDREIEVAHANWGSDRKTRSFIYERMRVKDVSPNNDWSLLTFWNKYIDSYGLPYKNHGFIYPPVEMAMAD